MHNELKVRDGTLDVFRCLCMFLIVLGHTYHYGVPNHDAYCWRYLFAYLLCWHVDGFAALSGWFGIKFTIDKFLRFYGIVIFYSIISIAVGRLCLNAATPLRINGGWYGNTYMCLMLVAPLLNAGIDELVLKNCRSAWIAWLGFASVIWINWLSGNCYIGFIAYDVAPFTLIQLTFIYVTARLIRKTNVYHFIKWWHILLFIAVFIICAIGCPGPRLNYLAPHTIFVAMAILLAFEKKYIRVPKWLEKIASKVAPSMFGVYLIHEVSSFGHEMLGFLVGKLAGFGIPLVWSVIICACGCFIFCLALDIFRRLFVFFVRHAIGKMKEREKK